MKVTPHTKNTFMIVFTDHDERARWLVAHGFRYSPGEGANARWVSDTNGGDTTCRVELTPLSPDLRDNLRVLTMIATLVKKEVTDGPDAGTAGRPGRPRVRA
jgi:hypothetical protein